MPESTDPTDHRPSEHPRSGHTPLHQHRPSDHRWSHQAAPSRPFGPTDPFERLWNNAALRIAGRTTVHAVRVTPDGGGKKCPAPACHTGHDRYTPEELEPVYDKPVNCDSCNSKRVAWDEGRPYDPNRNQMILPGMPLAPIFPPLSANGDAPSQGSESRTS